MSQKGIRGVRGMNDILPPESFLWNEFEALVHSWAAAYGYRPLRTPIVEQTALFKRAIGEVTDIVEKEMYAFEDALNGEHLTLRPEGTAGCVRAAIEHNLLHQGPQRLYYWGPMFRHERPQKGRYRQFHQIGVEALGFADPEIDAELIVMGARLWDDLGLTDVRLEINSLGDPEERAAHREALIAYFTAHQEELDEDSRRRLTRNPLRILDSKNPAMQPLIEGAPRLLDYLGAETRAHFDAVLALIEAAGIPYRINPRLVRGLDYYNRTVFEWVTPKLGAQGTICAGGRYDGLFAQLGGKPAPAAGFALGVERVLALWEACGGEPPRPELDVYLVHQGEKSAHAAFRLAEALRSSGFSVVVHAGGGSFKSQMKRADASGAEVAVILGESELASETATVKPLRRPGAQRQVPWAQLEEVVAQIQLGSEESDGAGTLA
ncbi:histidine--tRNA ligase [Hydrogenophilus thiooxidans]|uniref:histidine--tRNA ligase n=1 Tax=Hydrogenophilus thiooxidans TaxID=2820326 RepID=UPI001C217EC9|nr:histidine--tRNA ligase [Hydrogenophilus thiooxidans]